MRRKNLMGAVISSEGKRQNAYNVINKEETENCHAGRSQTSLMEAVEANREFSIASDFLSVDVRRVFSRYGYIGDAEQCRRLIREHMEKDNG